MYYTTKCLTFNIFSELFVVAIGFRERRSNLARRISSSNIQYGSNRYSKDNPIKTDHLVRFPRAESSLLF